MRSLRRSPTTIHYHGRTDEDETVSAVIFSINGVRWEYHLRPQQADDCIHILRVAGNGKALAYAKAKAIAFRRLDDDTAQATLLRHRGGIASRSKRVKPSMPNV